MSNNISRKGLAWGALVAVAASLFAGVPAHAAAGLTLAANSTSQVLSVPAGTPFQLIETASSEIPSSSYNTLAVSVVNNDAGAALVTVDGRATATIRTTTSRVVFSSATIAAAGNNQTIDIRSTSSATATFTITAWLDANANGVVDTGEYSDSKTVKFLGAADLTATTTFLKSPSYTSDSRTVQVRTTLDNVNTDQMALATNNGLGLTGYEVAAAAISVDLRSGTYDARNVPTDNSGNAASVFASADARAFYAFQQTNGAGGTAYSNHTTNALGGVEISSDTRNVWYAGAVITAQAYWNGTKIGAAVSNTGLVNGVANGIAIATVVGDNALASTSGSARTDNQSANVRLNSAFQVKITVTADSKAAIANQDVVFTVSSSFVTAAARLSINGTEYATSSSVRTVSGRTDASGVATLNLGVTGFGVHTASDSTSDLVVSAKVNNITSPTLTLFQTKAVADTANASFTPANQAVELGKNAAVVVTLNDQFGKAWAGDYTAQAVWYDSTVAGGTALVATTKFAALTNGTATVSFGSDANVTGDSRWTIQLRANDTVNGGYLDGRTEIGTAKVSFRTAAQLAAGNILTNAGDTTNGVRTSAARDVAAQDLTKAGYAAAAAGAKGSISGYAVVTTGRAIAYAAVTLKAAGVLFTDGTVYSVGSITVLADINGAFSVNYISNTSGTTALTVTAGSASVTTNLVVNVPAVNSGRSFGDVLAPEDTLLAGDTAVVTFSVRDLYGNQLTAPATISVRISGDITRDVTYSTQSVDAKGYFTVSASLAKTGTAYFTATYSSDSRLFTSNIRAVNWALENVTVDAPEAAVAGQNVDVVVTVLDPAGNPIKGFDVTATSTGVGNLTVAKATTDVNGQAYLKLFAATTELGWAYVTATSTKNGVVADVAGIQFQAAPTATDNVANLTLAVPASAQAGTVVDVVATATDADGNAVEGAVVSATSTGVGYLAIAGGTTDADGKVTLKLVVTAGENGTASVVAAAGDVTSEAASVTAGVTDANVTLAKKRVTVDWSFAANKKVVIVRDGVVIKSFTASSNAADSFSFNLKSGSHKVSVKVGGVTLDSQSYKIK